MIKENVIDSIKGAAWQMKKPEAKKEMINKLTDLIIKGLKVQADLESDRKSIEATANSILRWPNRDNIKKHANIIAKRMPGETNFNKVFFVLRSSLDKVKKSSVMTEDYEARKQEEEIKEWHAKVCSAVESKLRRKLSADEKKKLEHAVEYGKWANYFDKSDNQAAINKFAQIQDIITEENEGNYFDY